MPIKKIKQLLEGAEINPAALTLEVNTKDHFEIARLLHQLPVKGKVLVFNSPAGSSDWGAILHRNCWGGNGPLAIINRKAITLILTGAIASAVPTVVDFDTDPIESIDTGDWIKVDADKGIIEVYKRTE